MGSGFKDWAAGDVLTAADVDGYLMRQTVMTFADASARDTALSGVLDEGMVAYIEDTNAITVYNGSAWVSVIDSDVLTVDTANNRVGINDSTPSYALDVTGDMNATGDIRIGGTAIGEWTSYTPSLFNVTANSLDCAYAQINDIVFLQIKIDVASMSNFPVLTTPSGLNIANDAQFAHQGARFVDTGTASYAAMARRNTSTQFFFTSVFTGASYAGEGSVNATAPFTWASGDLIEANLWYRTA